MKNRTRVRIGAAVLGGAALAGALPAYAAVSASSPPAGVAVEIVGIGPLTARGAGTTVNLRITCPANAYYAYVWATVTQKVSNGIAGGSGSQQVSCTNVPQVVNLPINATPGGKPFKAGAVAAAQATLETYTRRGFVNLQVDGTFKIAK